MTNKHLYIAWGVLYLICAGLGFIPSPEGVAMGLMIFFSLVFFIPPAILVTRAVKSGDRNILKTVRNLALVSLSTTFFMLVLNILSVLFTETAGLVVYCILIMVSSPMVCGQVWVISLFLWACLLIVSWKHLKKA